MNTSHLPEVSSLRDNEEKYRSLFMYMLTEVHLWELVRDESGAIKTWRLLDANPAALKSWARTLPEVVGRTTDEIFPDSDATNLFMPIVNKIFTDGKPYVWESYFPDTDQYLQMVSIPVGETFISTGMDISKHRQREKELKRHKEELDVIVREKTEQLQKTVNFMAGRETRMVELKEVIRQLQEQLIEAGIKPKASIENFDLKSRDL